MSFVIGQFTGEMLVLTISVMSHSINHLKDYLYAAIGSRA